MLQREASIAEELRTLRAELDRAHSKSVDFAKRDKEWEGICEALEVENSQAAQGKKELIHVLNEVRPACMICKMGGGMGG